jgi:hypothetical protein
VLSLTLTDASTGACYTDTGEQQYATINGNVVLTGDPDWGMILVTVRLGSSGSTVLFSGWMTPSLAGTQEPITDTRPIVPGATLTYRARGWSSDLPTDLLASATVQTHPWCDSITITASISGRSGTAVHPTPAEESFGVLLDGNSIGAVNGAGTPITITRRGGASGTSHTVTIPILTWPSGSPDPDWEHNVTTQGIPSITVKDHSGATISPYGSQPNDGIQFVMP